MKNKKKKFDIICERIALGSGVSVEEVKEEMQSAIKGAFENPTEEQKAFHKKITKEGEIPTPEEVIDFIYESIMK